MAMKCRSALRTCQVREERVKPYSSCVTFLTEDVDFDGTFEAYKVLHNWHNVVSARADGS
jgi:hypothetical protein